MARALTPPGASRQRTATTAAPVTVHMADENARECGAIRTVLRHAAGGTRSRRALRRLRISDNGIHGDDGPPPSRLAALAHRTDILRRTSDFFESIERDGSTPVAGEAAAAARAALVPRLADVERSITELRAAEAAAPPAAA